MLPPHPTLCLTCIMWELIFCLIHFVQTPENTSPPSSSSPIHPCSPSPSNFTTTLVSRLLSTPHLLQHTQHSIGSQRRLHNHKFDLFDTLRRDLTEFFTYLSLVDSERQCPCHLKGRSGTPALAAAVAPPAQKLCMLNLVASNPMLNNFFFINSLTLV